MAQERKKTRIVLASILKPVDDTRMFEKMGQSLYNSDKYEVYIIGYPSVSHNDHTNIQLISLKPFPRLSIRRIWAKWEVFRIIRKLKPEILIFNTHELLLPAMSLKVIQNISIVYDLRENYYRNILHSGSFSKLLRWPLAALVRFKEKLLAPAVDHFFLAERSYEEEIKFHRGGWTVLENKAPLTQASGVRKQVTGNIRLLFSGTLAESTGVFEAIRIAKELHNLDPYVTITIVGYAADAQIRLAISEESQQNIFIRLIGGEQLVPHQEIMECINQSDAGILIYPPSPHTKHSRPTKLFEYLNAQLPIILDTRWPWTNEFSSIRPFLFLDREQPDYPSLLLALKGGAFYTDHPADITWASEEPKFLDALRDL